MNSHLEMTDQDSRVLPGVRVLRAQGSIDSDTASKFEKKLESMASQGFHKILVNLGEVDYISSAGIGIFIGLLHHFRSLPDGDLKACSASKKIMSVFQSIGLDEMLEIFPEEISLTRWTALPEVQEATTHFALTVPPEEIFSGEEFTLRVESRDAQDRPARDYKGRPHLTVSEGLVFPGELSGMREGVWEGRVKVSQPGVLTVRVHDGRHEGALEVRCLERPGKAVFPLQINCRTCQTAIRVPGPDIYRCENCDETFSMDEWGHIFPLKTGSVAVRKKSRYKGMELKINADVNYLGVIRTVISGLCQKEGMDEVTTNSVVLAIEEVLLNLIEHGNDFDPWQIFRLRVEFQKHRLKIQIRDFGDPFDVTRTGDFSLKANVLKGSKRGVGGFLVNKIMDQVQYRSYPRYNQLTMAKRYGAEGK